MLNFLLSDGFGRVVVVREGGAKSPHFWILFTCVILESMAMFSMSLMMYIDAKMKTITFGVIWRLL